MNINTAKCDVNIVWIHAHFPRTAPSVSAREIARPASIISKDIKYWKTYFGMFMDLLESLGSSDLLFYFYILARYRRWNTLFHNRDDVSTNKADISSLKKSKKFICRVMFLRYVTLFNRTLIVLYLSRHKSCFFRAIKICLFWSYLFRTLMWLPNLWNNFYFL